MLLLKINYFLVVLLFLSTTIANGQENQQSNDLVATAYAYVHHHLDDWGLEEEDIQEMTIQDMYTDKSSGITRIYFLQKYQQIPVYNAILNLNLDKHGNVFHSGNRFVQNLQSKVNRVAPIISAKTAIQNVISNYGFTDQLTTWKNRISNDTLIFEKGTIAKKDITAVLTYQPMENELRLSWDILFAPASNPDVWSTRVDAATGEILNEYNWTVYCNQDDVAVIRESSLCYENPGSFLPVIHEEGTGAQYNVWPQPYDSPMHGPRTLVVNPADSIASPYGWHDSNGQEGPEFTVTKGNNVFAYQDRDELGYSSGDEPDGGPSLHFDFPFNAAWEPEQYIDAAVVNSFYWVNYMHDFSYRFGFDEASGNFQLNNYGRGGVGTDNIHIETQSGANTGKQNNAFYSHGLEGDNGSIAMHLFRGTTRYLTVDQPVSIAGTFKTNLASPGWGPGAYLNGQVISGELIRVHDGIENPFSSDACEEILNAQALAGKIAFIDRGGCEFGWKALQAQQAGAIAIVICSFDDDDYTMNPGTYGSQINIPIVMIGTSDCQTISKFEDEGLFVTLKEPDLEGPAALASDLDNSVIAHEYGHGISSRLVGGPSANCLGNLEKMDEGWSDFFALAVTAKPGDHGETKRGFGTYAYSDIPEGRGFRRYPYSTDMDVMPLTYGDVAPNQERHNIGEMWAATLWDMYWVLSEKYGWSANPYDTTSGNYKAIRLVFDGLKNTPCYPGFVDGRNGILAAERILYNGIDSCLLWEVFARRGLGFSADQGSSFDAGDQQEAFDLPPGCMNQMLITKSVTPNIQAGQPIEVTLTISNYKQIKATNVIVTDEIPEGTSYMLNSSNTPLTQQGNLLVFELGVMEIDQVKTITYTLQTPFSNWSKRYFFDEINEESAQKWVSYKIGTGEPNDWYLTDQFFPHTGIQAWHSPQASHRIRQALELNPDVFTFHVEGDHPAICFYHRYDTQGGINGGVIDIKDVNDEVWTQVKEEEIIRNKYPTKLHYRTFLYPDVPAFSGNSGDDLKATYADLSRWQGQNIHVRFRSGADINSHNGIGWLIDDIEFMDMLYYNAEACVTSNEGDQECAIAPEGGTIVDSREVPTSVTDEIDKLNMSVYPNPAVDKIFIAIENMDMEEMMISILSLDGKVLMNQKVTANEILSVDTNHFLPGMYLLKITNGMGQAVRKFTVQ